MILKRSGGCLLKLKAGSDTLTRNPTRPGQNRWIYKHSQAKLESEAWAVAGCRSLGDEV